MRSILILLLASGLAVAAEPTSQPAAAPSAQPTAKAPAPSARLTPAQVKALGDVPEGPCSAKPLDLALPVEGCVARGPYPGEIKGGTKGKAHDDVKAALAACATDPACVGVSTHWYIGAPWTPMTGDAQVAVDKASYGCAVVIDCAPAAP